MRDEKTEGYFARYSTVSYGTVSRFLFLVPETIGNTGKQPRELLTFTPIPNIFEV